MRPCSVLALVWVTAASLTLAGCGGGDEEDREGSENGTRPHEPGDSTTGGEPLTADCDRLQPVSLSDPTTVATEEELRDAVAAGGEIQLSADITASAPFEVTSEIIIDGGGHVISGNDATHLFVSRMTDLTIQNVTLRDGNNQVADSEHFSRRSGAAIMASGGNGSSDGPATGSLTVIDVTFDSNRIKPSGPGDLRGGALYVFNLPNATISGSTFTGNVGSNGGAIGGLGSSLSIIGCNFQENQTNGTEGGAALEGNGGAISLDAVSQNGQTAYLGICGSEFRNNVSQGGGGAIYLVAHWYTGTEVVIDQSVFAYNGSTLTEEGQGGAIFGMDDEKDTPQIPELANRWAISNSTFVGNETAMRAGAVWYWTMDGRMTITNSTFEGNQTFSDGTGMGGAVAASRGPMDLVSCTFANNYAKFHGGGIQAGGDADVSITNCLFYNNTSNRDGGWANFQSNRELDRDGGGNLQYLDPDLVIDSNSDALVSANAVRDDPLLEQLADNGGPTWTMALAEGSPAINAGVADDAPETDQRGLPRDDQPDIGAFEVQ